MNGSDTSYRQPVSVSTQQHLLQQQQTGFKPSNDFSLPFHSRQLHAPRSPLYRPAVLRAPEARKPTSISPPSIDTRLEQSNSDEDLTAYGKRREQARQDVTAIEDWAVEEEYGKVTGPPRRDHWKPDSSAAQCESTQCTKAFTLFERRHHCRRCGKVYCAEHSSKELRLDQEAIFHPFGSVVRGCDGCFQDFRDWKAAMRSGSASSGESSVLSGSPITPKNSWPKMTGEPGKSALASVGAFGKDNNQKVGSYGASVPRDWSWSTF